MTAASVIDTSWHPLVDGNPPRWACGWGQDRRGVFVEFGVDEIVQRLRWIPPGQFMMGSPDDEPGRFDSEGPRHEVTIARGFWLFDTPCTQGLWRAVMGDNPSRFKSPDRPVTPFRPDRPVEQVSWNDVQDFLARINQRIPGLNLILPSEAQWEYACRAGTDTALYTGPIEILGKRNAPALDPIAWYGGNSGVDFDLPEGENSKSWLEKQYPHETAGTRPVGLKRYNPWGLHDMLGNVWEWCSDEWHESYDGAPTDGQPWSASAQSGVKRATRGGSWDSHARDARAADRRWNLPDARGVTLGFRCARVQG